MEAVCCAGVAQISLGMIDSLVSKQRTSELIFSENDCRQVFERLRISARCIHTNHDS